MTPYGQGTLRGGDFGPRCVPRTDAVVLGARQRDCVDAAHGHKITNAQRLFPPSVNTRQLVRAVPDGPEKSVFDNFHKDIIARIFGFFNSRMKKIADFFAFRPARRRSVKCTCPRDRCGRRRGEGRPRSHEKRRLRVSFFRWGMLCAAMRKAPDAAEGGKAASRSLCLRQKT